MHSGDIQVDSNDDPAEGTTGTAFTVKLPRMKAEDEQAGNE
jgi:signal transduction histidine kinase